MFRDTLAGAIMGCEIVWKLRDKEAFERYITLSFARVERLSKAVIERFYSDLQLHPVECQPWSAFLPSTFSSLDK